MMDTLMLMEGADGYIDLEEGPGDAVGFMWGKDVIITKEDGIYHQIFRMFGDAPVSAFDDNFSTAYKAKSL